MKHFKRDTLLRDLVLLIAITALVFPLALSWGGPFVTGASDGNAIAAQQPQQDAVFQGTGQRNGERFFLRETSGQIYQLDDSQHAQPFEGKTVRITGTLDSGAKLIHVAR